MPGPWEDFAAPAAPSGAPGPWNDFKKPPAPSWVSSSDQAIATFTHHVMNAFSPALLGAAKGTEEAFGAAPVATPLNSLSPETQKEWQNAGFFNKKGENDFAKAALQGLAQTVAAGAQLFGRATSAAIGAPLGAAAAVGTQLGLEGLEGEEGLVGAATDPGLLMLLGPAGAGGTEAALAESANARRLNSLKTNVTKAVAHGIIGPEADEASFYSVKGSAAWAPEVMTARLNAAKEVGEKLPEEPPNPPKTIHELARQMEPEAHQRYDELTVKKEQLRQDLSRLSAERESLPEVVEARAKIASIMDTVGDDYERLDGRDKRRLANAYKVVDNAMTQPHPEAAEVGKKIMDADIEQRDLLPTLQDTYRRARQLMPADEDTLPRLAEGTLQGKGVTPEKTANAELNAPKSAQSAEKAIQEPEKPKPGPLLKAFEDAHKDVNIPEVARDPRFLPAAPVAEDATGATEQPKGKFTGLRPVVGTGETKVRGLSAGVEAKALQNNLAQNFGDLAEYKAIELPQQAADTVAFLNKDYEAAKDVAMGRKAPPAGLLHASVFKAVEDRAIAEGDVETLADLGQKSKVLAQVTTMAQNLRVLRERDPTSPVGAIQDIFQARKAAMADFEDQKAAAIKDMKEAMGRAASPNPVWESFVNSIMCKE